jgi:molybdopterin-guanine dinucleotide biosynthesis protein
MRVAVAGTHRTGKTTLVEALAAQLPDHDLVAEPYHALEDDGHEFSDPPTVEDFELQLRHSLAALAEPRPHAIFDRSPLDLVAYLQVLDDDLDLEPWLDDLRTAMRSLDLVIVLSAHEDRRLRARVDERLATLLLDDPFGLDTPTLEVAGTVEQRVERVLRVLRQGRHSPVRRV